MTVDPALLFKDGDRVTLLKEFRYQGWKLFRIGTLRSEYLPDVTGGASSDMPAGKQTGGYKVRWDEFDYRDNDADRYANTHTVSAWAIELTEPTIEEIRRAFGLKNGLKNGLDDVLDDVLEKVRETLESDSRSPRWVAVIDNSSGTGQHYLDIEVEGHPYRLVLEDHG